MNKQKLNLLNPTMSLMWWDDVELTKKFHFWI